uniref:MAM domain-containing protein n=1 Tax=Caenorhabditis japonica TaxID=281687 RepID=A0A8R1DF28_CAEJA
MQIHVEQDQSFLILASDPRPSHQNGQLVSLPIGCQQATGILSFRYWRSRARTIGSEPKLDICTRKVLEVDLENCMTVVPTDNHTIIASIPPVMEPFVIVLKGYNFENEPEGGLILIDEIEYFAMLDRPEDCVAKNLMGEVDIEEFPKKENKLERTEEKVSGDTPEYKPEAHYVSRDVSQQAAPTIVNSSSSVTELIQLNENSNNDCQSLQCLMDQKNAPCDYKRSGSGSQGEGYLVGWRITSVNKNVANKLTGIHHSPGSSLDSNFLVANFQGFRRNKVEDRFVLEAPEFTVTDAQGAYLSFRKYLYTKGLYLSVCEDGYATRCFWNVYENSAEPFAKKWTKEVVLLPGQLTTFYIIAWQNTSTVVNFGQIGLSEIGLFSDSQAISPLC